MNFLRHITAALCALLSPHFLSPARAPEPQLYTYSHPAMGTTYTLFLYAQTPAAGNDEAEKAFAIVDDVDALLSNYRPQSELSRINREAGASPVTTDPETSQFLKDSLRWSALSDGAFDITVGALMKSWGFFRSSGHVPTSAELDAVRAKVGWQKVRLDPAARTVRFLAPGIELDPGGIGKGFAVDRVIEQLRRDGVQAALFSAGSSTIFALGAPPGKSGWPVNVPDPRHSGAKLATVILRDTSLSTASCAEKHFIVHAHLYCHIMDPRLAMPVEGRLQATVITPVATDGDALSNVMFVDDAASRARVMKELPAADSALVISGVPEEDQQGGDTKAHSAAVASCEAYRWPGEIPGICKAAAPPPAVDQKEKQ